MTGIAITSKKRIDSIDILRGIVMVIMALDHTRDFFQPIDFDPTDLTKASTALFLTRFITHYCAATFVFLAGTSAFLYLSRGKTKAQAAKFLLSRGLWLVLLELTIIHWGWGAELFLQVIWAIGISMMVLALLIYLPKPVILIFGLLLIFGHDLFDHINTSSFTPTEQLAWAFLHVQQPVTLWGNSFLVLYPLIPWVGVMATGYCFGTLFTLGAAVRKKWLLTLGLSAIGLFVIIRYFNFYGDASLWTTQGNLHRTILSFIDVSKYPPSLDYLLITLGPGMLLLAILENTQNTLTNIFVVYGRVPLFYYILHLYLLRLLSIIAGSISGLGDKLSVGLPYVYLVWLFAVSLLYFPCRWYMKYKKDHKQWWLSYL
ncbi:MAG: heparan-alpha-glucosaminide N-acetyltransferase domain-containing protein [Mucilaginibacter sp.]